MPEKHSYEYIKTFIELKDGILLSKEYVNQKQKLNIQCNKCQHIWSVSYEKIKWKNSWCPECVLIKKRFSYDFVKSFIETKDGILLSKEYKNQRQKLNIQCNKCQYVWSASFGNIKDCDSWCPKCGIESRKLKRKHSYEYIKSFIESKGGILLSKEYKNNKQKLKIQCSKGHIFNIRFECITRNQWCFECSPEKMKQTFLDHYGVDNPTKNKEIRLKAAISANKTKEIVYWKTNETIHMLGWEPLAANYWNKNKEEYEYEFRTFTMSDGRTYTPDFYLPRLDKWIEVKGRWYDDAKEKWEWFHKEHPNSELWDKNRLKKLGIL